MINNILRNSIEISRNSKIIVQISVDITLIVFSFFLALSIRLNDFKVITEYDYWLIIFIVTLLTVLINYTCGFYESVIRFISEKFFLTIIVVTFFSSLLTYPSAYFLDIMLPRSVPFIYFSFLLVFTFSSRFFFKYFFLSIYFSLRQPIAIYGSGEVGRNLLYSLNENSRFHPEIFIDDNIDFHNKRINGLKVFSFNQSLIEMKKRKISVVILAMNNISNFKKLKIIHKLDRHHFAVKLISDKLDFFDGKSGKISINNITINDILGRKEVPLKKDLIKKNIFEKTVLVTGCGGSIGSELCKQIVKIRPKNLIYLDNSEFALYKINEEINSYIKTKNLKLNTYPMLGSVQDKIFLNSLFNKHDVNTIYHTAAYKHVSLVENNIIEGIKNNVFGTLILAETAISKKIDTFVLISSDKAVRPTNYMGASKRIAELILQAFSDIKSDTIFSIVRFGNVIGSSGSVIPLFAKQIEQGGPVTLTHKNVTRYFMSIREAVGLIIQAGAMAEKGDLFVLDMGKPKNIMNLAQKIIRLYGKKPVIENKNNLSDEDPNIIKIKVTGLRPGEKIYEELLLNDKSLPTNHERIFKAREKKITEKELYIFLKELKKLCDNDDLKNLKIYFQNAPIDFHSNNSTSENMRELQ